MHLGAGRAKKQRRQAKKIECIGLTYSYQREAVTKARGTGAGKTGLEEKKNPWNGGAAKPRTNGPFPLTALLGPLRSTERLTEEGTCK